MADDPYRKGQRVEDLWVSDNGKPVSTDATEAEPDGEPFWRSESWLLEPLAEDPQAPPVDTGFEWGGSQSSGDSPSEHLGQHSSETSPAWESPSWDSPAWDTASIWQSTATTASEGDGYDPGSPGTSATASGAGGTDAAGDGEADAEAHGAAEADAEAPEQPEPQPLTSEGYDLDAGYASASEIDWDSLGKDDDQPVSWSDVYTNEAVSSWAAAEPDTEPASLTDEPERVGKDRAKLSPDNPHHEKRLDPLAVSTNASDFAAEKSALSTVDPPANGFPSVVYRMSRGHVRLKPTKEERLRRSYEDDVRRSIDGLRQITFTNPKGGSGKTTAALLTSMTLGPLRGGYVLAWDNNETQGTLGVRARPDHHANTVRDLIADLPSFSGPVPGRVGDLAKYVRSQGDAMFEVLASDEQATAGEMMTAAAFQAVREVVARFYKLICVDTGNNVRAANWAASIDSTDLLVVTSSVRWESAYSASRMLDYLEQSGRGDLVANAVTILTMPQSTKGLNLPQVETHFSVRTREVLYAPFDPQLDNGDQIRMSKLSEETRQAWLRITAAIARGL